MKIKKDTTTIYQNQLNKKSLLKEINAEEMEIIDVAMSGTSGGLFRKDIDYSFAFGVTMYIARDETYFYIERLKRMVAASVFTRNEK